jgi:putative transcriptional regulator
MSSAGESILTGALEALEFTQGQDNGCQAHIPDDIDVSAIRSRMNMTQQQFSSQFGLSKRTLQDWEQGRRHPTGVSRVLLQVLAKEPDAVIRALQP